MLFFSVMQKGSTVAEICGSTSRQRVCTVSYSLQSIQQLRQGTYFASVLHTYCASCKLVSLRVRLRLLMDALLLEYAKVVCITDLCSVRLSR